MKPLFLALLFLGCGILPAYSQDVDIDLIIQIESGGNPNAYNAKSGAIGLMQITPICLKEFESFRQKRLAEYARKYIKADYIGAFPYLMEDLYNPILNVEVGTWYLNTRIPQMLRAYKIPDTIDFRLACYNWGIGNVVKWYRDDIPLPLETQQYIKKYHKLEGLK